jgi:hypothetical protein
MLTAVLSLAFFELMLHGGHSRLKQVQAGEFFFNSASRLYAP